jgi:chromosomal replication initiation ATPase DnaA
VTNALAGHFPDLPRPEAPSPQERPKLLRAHGGSPRKTRRTEFTAEERALAESIAKTYGVTVDGMLARSNRHTFVVPRDHFIATLKWSTDLSLTDLGALFGKDHTSIYEAIRRHEARLNEEP